MNKKSNFCFFLGGYDAEMCEIRKLLEENEQKFYDHKLKWGAKLSSYKKEMQGLESMTIPVFIELILDISYRSDCIIIDHHNLKNGDTRKSSIEQVAELVNVKLNRWQQMIAINDVQWIDGLVNFGASKEEIEKIRQYDRKCQGISAEEERQAEEAIEKLESYGNLAIVKIPHIHASTVMDRLYGKFENILVVSPDEVNFSGSGDVVMMLSEIYENCWYGGALPERGFWGLKAKNKQIVDKIISFFKEV